MKIPVFYSEKYRVLSWGKHSYKHRAKSVIMVYHIQELGNHSHSYKHEAKSGLSNGIG